MAHVWMFRGGTKHEKDIEQAIKEPDGQSDRAAAIVGATILDLLLTEALTIYLHDNSKITKDFFSMNGPVGEFGPKTDLAFLIGLVTNETHRDLITIKDIRNRFAHRLSISDFKSQSIATLTNNLKICEMRTCRVNGAPDKWPHGCWMNLSDRETILADSRKRFILTIQVLCRGLLGATETAMPTAIF